LNHNVRATVTLYRATAFALRQITTRPGQLTTATPGLTTAHKQTLARIEADLVKAGHRALAKLLAEEHTITVDLITARRTGQPWSSQQLRVVRLLIAQLTRPAGTDTPTTRRR
jgi:hypothetical protein